MEDPVAFERMLRARPHLAGFLPQLYVGARNHLAPHWERHPNGRQRQMQFRLEVADDSTVHVHIHSNHEEHERQFGRFLETWWAEHGHKAYGAVQVHSSPHSPVGSPKDFQPDTPHIIDRKE